MIGVTLKFIAQYFNLMTRGNQRELARVKNAKKSQDQLKRQKKGDPAKRMEADAIKMREKQAAGMLDYTHYILYVGIDIN